MSAPRDRKFEYVEAFCSACRALTQHRRSDNAMWTCENIDRPQHRASMYKPLIPIYVAGASAELERAEAILTKINTPPLSLRYCITKDWPAQVRAERIEGGKADRALSDTLRQQIAAEDVAAVFRAEILWLLLPPPTIHTAGMWVELGVGLCKRTLSEQLAGRLGLPLDSDVPFIICSGYDRAYVFTANVNLTFATDEAALQWLHNAADNKEEETAQ